MNEDYELFDPNNPDHLNSKLYEVVESFENEGIKNTYSCYIDGEGNPQLQPFGSEETDEINGVEVTFPVKKEDFSKFREEAEIVYRPFELRPNVVGNSDYEVKDFSVLISSEDNSDTADWQLVEPVQENRWDRTRIRVAVQGNIEYPLNTNQFYDDLSKNAQELSAENYRLHFDIGDLDIAASREELGYDKETISNIVAKFEKMALEIAAVQNEKIEAFDTKYQAMQYISKIQSTTNFYKNFEFTYKDEIIENSFKIHKDHKIVKYFRNHRGQIGRSEYGDSYSKEFNFTVPKEDVIFVLNDNDKKSQSVTKARSLVTRESVVYLLQDAGTLSVLGNPEFQRASEIESPSKVSGKGNTGTGKFFKKFNPSSYTDSQWYDNYASADNVDLDVTKKFYYVTLNSRRSSSNVNIYSLNSRRSSSNVNIYSLKKVAEHLGLIPEDTVVFGVSYSHAGTKKFKGYEGTEFTSFIKDKISRSRKFKTEIKKFADFKTQQNIKQMSGKFFDLMTSDSFLESLDDDNMFKILRADYDKIDINNSNFLNLVQDVAYRLDITIPKSDYTLHNDIEIEYPLISQLGWRADKEQILNYVKGLDLLKKLKADEDSANDTDNKNTEEIA